MANAVQKTNQKTSRVQRTDQQRSQRSDGSERMSTRPVYLPRADIYETHENIVVVAEMPGVAPDSIDITLEGRVLAIQGKTGDHDHAGYRQVYGEYEDGDYERVFTLSEDIDRSRIEATHKNGILHLVLPKAEGAKARKIELKAL